MGASATYRRLRNARKGLAENMASRTGLSRFKEPWMTEEPLVRLSFLNDVVVPVDSILKNLAERRLLPFIDINLRS
jgi:hypothetical protein